LNVPRILPFVLAQVTRLSSVYRRPTQQIIGHFGDEAFIEAKRISKLVLLVWDIYRYVTDADEVCNCPSLVF